MRKTAIALLAAVSVITTAGFFSCKTTEANYRKAYEKAIAGKEDNMPIDSTVYGKYRRQADQRLLVSKGDTIEVTAMRVVVTSGEGTPNEYLRAYSVVAGEFKQIFNARSLRDRLRDMGYLRTFIVANAEPYYYIVIDSFDDLNQAKVVLEKFRKNPPVPLRKNLPYILSRVNRY